MGLTDSEVQRVRYEMGFPNLSVSAEPMIGIHSYFDNILQPYLLGSVATTSSTPVTAATSPTPTSIVLVSATGFAAGNVVIIDVDTRQERVTVQSLAATTLTAQLSLAHSGTYPVVLEGGESIIRDLLNKLRKIGDSIDALRSRAGIKRIEGEIEFFGGGSTLASQGVDPVTQLLALREEWRDELAFALGISRNNAGNSAGGSDVSVY